MPTYRNDSETTYTIRNSAGVDEVVLPDESVQTFFLLTLSGMTKTAEVPYFNPVPASGVHTIESTGVGDDAEITLNTDTDEIEIWNESGADITCFLRALANTPGLKVLANSIRNISSLAKTTNAIVLQFSAAVTSGQCYVTELKG